MRCSSVIIQLLLLFKCQFSEPRLSGETTMAIKHLSKGKCGVMSRLDC